MIASKTHSEILAMKLWTRSRWYKTILPEEKEEAMKMVETARRAKMSEFMIKLWKDTEKRDKHSALWTGKNNPMYGRKGKNSPMYGKTGEKHPMYGTTRTEEIKAKMSGENHPNWQGGKSFESYGIEFNNELKEQVRGRDNYTCQECHQTEDQLGYVLDVHHIDYDKKNNSSDNLISLCRSCHAQTNYSREDWTVYFGRTIGG